eukprot:Nk52_evm1s1145 gene=Nk52_evmTU1s1145
MSSLFSKDFLNVLSSGNFFPFNEASPELIARVIGASAIATLSLYYLTKAPSSSSSPGGKSSSKARNSASGEVCALQKQNSDFNFAKKFEQELEAKIKKMTSSGKGAAGKQQPNGASSGGCPVAGVNAKGPCRKNGGDGKGTAGAMTANDGDGRIKSLIAILQASKENAVLAVKTTDVLTELANMSVFGENKELIRKLGGLPTLISHLDTAENDIQIKSMWALSNLAISQANQYVLRDGFKKITNLMEIPFLDINAQYFRGKGMDFQSPLELLEYISAKNSCFYANSAGYICLLRNQGFFSKENEKILLEDEKKTCKEKRNSHNNETFFTREHPSGEEQERHIVDLRLVELSTKAMLNVLATEDHHKYVRDNTDIFIRLFCLWSREVTRSVVKELFYSPFMSMSLNKNDLPVFHKVISRFDDAVSKSVLSILPLYRGNTGLSHFSKVSEKDATFARCIPDDLTVLTTKVLVNLGCNSMNVGQMTDNSVIFPCLIFWVNACMSRLRIIFKEINIQANGKGKEEFKKSLSQDATNLYDLKVMMKNCLHLFRYLIIENTKVFNIKTIITQHQQFILHAHSDMFIEACRETMLTCTSKTNEPIFGDVDVINLEDIVEFDAGFKTIFKQCPDL